MTNTFIRSVKLEIKGSNRSNVVCVALFAQSFNGLFVPSFPADGIINIYIRGRAITFRPHRSQKDKNITKKRQHIITTAVAVAVQDTYEYICKI